MSRRVSRALTVLLCFLLFAVLSPAAFADDEASPVKVIFSCQDESALPGLRVFDQAGIEYTPMADANSGEIQYGSFLLSPGEYSYAFHDEGGRYEGFSDHITVSPAIKYIIPISPTPVIHTESFSFTYIDPIYEGIITEADIPAVSAEQIAAAEQALRELVTFEADSQRKFFAQHYWKQNTYYDTVEEAGLFLRSQVADFQDTATLCLCSDYALSSYSLSQKLPLIWSAAIAHTGTSTEGDYLRYEYGGFKVESYSYTGTKDGLYYYQIPFTFYHFTTAEQEDQLTPVVNNILAQLDLNGKSDYQKISAIYDYLCANVTYGGSGNLKFTAYSALINNTAYCQGYSTAFYRLCLSAGVNTRIITSSGMGHAWNIAALDGAYYELDSTWDAGYAPSTYRYFLKGSDYWLVNHKNSGGSTIGDQYKGVDFADSYSLARNNYGNVPLFDDVSAIPVESSPSALKDAVINLEDFLKMQAMHMPNGAHDIDRFVVSVVPKAVSSTNNNIRIFDVSVSITAYQGNKALMETLVDQTRLSPDCTFSFTLPVPESWPEKLMHYTRTGNGFADDTGYLPVTNENLVSFDSIARLGRFTLQPVKYTVSFDTDGGSAVLPQYFLSSGNVLPPATPTKDGYWFTGWYTDNSFETLFDFNAAITADTTLFARWAVPDFVLPAALTAIEEEAFRGGAFSFVQLPEQTVSVGSYAFADCAHLAFIYIPENTTAIDPDAFHGITALTILGFVLSPAEAYADTYGFAFVPLDHTP